MGFDVEGQTSSAEQGKKKGKEEAFRKPLGIPAKFSAEEFIKALKVLNDKGGSGKIRELAVLYGVKKKEKLSRALKFHDELGYANKKGHSYYITDEGRKLISSTDDSKKNMLAETLKSYEPYKNVIIALNNASEKSLKKDNITDIWSTIAGGGKRIREYMTLSFASLSSWAGLIEDTGRTCKLIEAIQPPQPSIPDSTPSETGRPSGSISVSFCPFCKGTDIGLVDEEALRFIDRVKDTIVYLKRKFVCRTCRGQFSRTSQESIPNIKTEESKQRKTKKNNVVSKQTTEKIAT